MCQRPLDSQWAIRFQVRTDAASAVVVVATTGVMVAAARAAADTKVRMRMVLLDACGVSCRVRAENARPHVAAAPRGSSYDPETWVPRPRPRCSRHLRPDGARRDLQAVPVCWDPLDGRSIGTMIQNRSVGSQIGLSP